MPQNSSNIIKFPHPEPHRPHAANDHEAYSHQPGSERVRRSGILVAKVGMALFTAFAFSVIVVARPFVLTILRSIRFLSILAILPAWFSQEGEANQLLVTGLLLVGSFGSTLLISAYDATLDRIARKR